MTKASSATENYLKTIFSLSLLSEDGQVKVSDISKRLDISMPAVTDMIKKLTHDKYVTSKPYKGIKLTQKGRAIGCNMVRHHRIWEVFLNQELDVPLDQVHDEAERLEHACSDYLIDRIEAKLGFPTLDPHGNPIPDRNGNLKRS